MSTVPVHAPPKLKVVKSEGAGHQAEVILESSSIEPLNTQHARAQAVAEAAKLGLASPGISKVSGAYPVDEHGETGDDVIMARVPVAAYRQDFTVLSAR